MRVKLLFDHVNDFPEQRKWVGITGEVELPSRATDPSGYFRIIPDNDRPDGHGRDSFLWAARRVESID